MRLSKDMPAKLGASIHLDKDGDAVDFAALGVYGLKLHRTSAGHAAIGLLDFPSVSSTDAASRAAAAAEVFDQFPKQEANQSTSRGDACCVDAFDGNSADGGIRGSIVDHASGPEVIAALAAERGGLGKPPNKNSKKIKSSAQKVAISDGIAPAAFPLAPSRARLPAGRRPRVKQKFAGKMGPTPLASATGLNVGAPLEKSTRWGASTPLGRRMHDKEILNEQPHCLAATHPRSPRGNWSRCDTNRGDVTTYWPKTNRSEKLTDLSCPRSIRQLPTGLGGATTSRWSTPGAPRPWSSPRWTTFAS